MSSMLIVHIVFDPRYLALEIRIQFSTIESGSFDGVHLKIFRWTFTIFSGNFAYSGKMHEMTAYTESFARYILEGWTRIFISSTFHQADPEHQCWLFFRFTW
ncbi:unnamed protein product [Caenorhabditis nigoni]